MRIAVNTRFLLRGELEGYGYFIRETFQRITRAHPGHQFIFIFDRPFDREFLFAPNVEGVVTGPPARHPLLWKFWYDVRVPAVLKKFKADVFVSPDGFGSLATRVPQCLVLHDLAFLHHPGFIHASHLRFYKKYTGRFLEKASIVATVSEFSKRDIISHYPMPEQKIGVVGSAAKECFVPLGYEAREKVKQKFTGGREFFLHTGAIHPRKNLVHLLKAFSLFKKRQQSGMKLVLAGRLAWKYGSFIKDLESYKYRDDVVLTGYLEESDLAALTGAAYAAVYPSWHEGFGVPVLEAMQCGVPVITSSDSSMQEIAGEAALYAPPGEFSAIAENMMRLYKDENLRRQMAEMGRTRCLDFSWDQTAEKLWSCIRKTIG
ncbi:MAG: glycosyltransferase family 4 protein [Chitinophagaceae bacterium]